MYIIVTYKSWHNYNIIYKFKNLAFNFLSNIQKAWPARVSSNLDDLKSPSNARNKFHKGRGQRTVPRKSMSLFEFDHRWSLDKDFRDFRMLKENCKSSFKKLGEYTVKRDFIDLQRQYHRQTKVSFRWYSDSLHKRRTSDLITK